MKISLITVCYNSEKTIEETICSVINQDYKNIEYIVIDGNSTDGTKNIILKYLSKISLFISEKDAGIYDAINKGILLSTGDVIGIINSDDTFTSFNCISNIVNEFQDFSIDAVYGDVVFVNKKNSNVRYYSSNYWKNWKFKIGMMIAHPTFYCKRNIFFDLGLYRNDFLIAADYELLIRFFIIGKIKTKYLKHTLIQMKTGGISNSGIKSKLLLNKEILKACKINKIKTNYFFIYFKYVIKIFQYRNPFFSTIFKYALIMYL